MFKGNLVVSPELEPGNLKLEYITPDDLEKEWVKKHYARNDISPVGEKDWSGALEFASDVKPGGSRTYQLHRRTAPITTPTGIATKPTLRLSLRVKHTPQKFSPSKYQRQEKKKKQVGDDDDDDDDDISSASPSSSASSALSALSASSASVQKTGSKRRRANTPTPKHGPKHKCNECGKRYGSARSLASHRGSHTKDKQLQTSFSQQTMADEFRKSLVSEFQEPQTNLKYQEEEEEKKEGQRR